MYGGPQNPGFIEAMINLTGIQYSKDLDGGRPNCVTIAPQVG